MSFQPLSVRTGQRTDDGPFEGVPKHLRAPIEDWIRDALFNDMVGWDESLLDLILTTFRVATPSSQQAHQKFAHLMLACKDNDVRLLDVLDFLVVAVRDFQHDGRAVSRLDLRLSSGASVWRVADEGVGLTRRVDQIAAEGYNLAVGAADQASIELKEAWSKVYGLHPDPSDAWDHSIKALEAVLKPIVLPNKPDATLGHVVGELKANTAFHTFHLRDNGLRQPTNPSETLVGMLRLVWPNPDRHQGSNHRTPAIDEARAVVHLAILAVQWARSGTIA